MFKEMYIAKRYTTLIAEYAPQQRSNLPKFTIKNILFLATKPKFPILDTIKQKKNAGKKNSKSHLKNPSANGICDLLGVPNLMPGDHSEFRDDGLRVEGELREDVFVTPDDIIRGQGRRRVLSRGLLQLLLPLPEHGVEPHHDRWRRRSRTWGAVGGNPRVIPRRREPLLLHGTLRNSSSWRRSSRSPDGISRIRVRVTMWIDRSHE